LRGLRATGYLPHIVYFWLPSPEVALLRVRQRVLAGGHAVPEETIRRRYTRGWPTSSSSISPWRLRGGCTTMRLSEVRASSPGAGVKKSMKSSMKSSGGTSEPREKRSWRKRTILELMTRGDEVDRAVQRAVREALIRHKKLGESVAVWRDGKAVILPPEEIPC